MAETLRQLNTDVAGSTDPATGNIMIQLIFLLALLLCLIPLIPGVIGLILPAFSWLPPLGHQTPGLSAFTTVIHWPGLGESILLSLFTGLGSTILALLFTFTILQRYWDSEGWRRLERTLSPMLAMPHVAFAIGFAFLLSPSGWLYRLLETVGIPTGQAFSLIQDPYGVGMMLALAIKETPFLLMMSIPVLQQLQTARLLTVATSLGYSYRQSWLKVIMPQWLPLIRLPLFAVAAYGLSVVDVALIIGPTRPTTLAVLIWQWFNEPDLHLLPRAAAGALLLLWLTALTLLLMRLCEHALVRGWKSWQLNGARAHRHRRLNAFRLFRCPAPISASKNYASSSMASSSTTGLGLYWPFVAIPVLVIPVLAVWSVALRWRFPDLLPSRYSLRFWQQEMLSLFELAANSLTLALASSLTALILAIGCLEYRQQTQRGLPIWLIATPLVVPQLSLLFGVQIATYLIPGQHYWLWVYWSHLFFVFPYLYLTLDGAWRSYDIRLDQCSRSLGMTTWQTWWKVKRPQVQPAMIMGLAVGISVSLAQYLPTQMLGAGRISTITTEAVALASGQDRRVSAIYGLIQGSLPFFFFTLAFVANRLTSHYRHGRPYTRSTLADDTVCGKPHYK